MPLLAPDDLLLANARWEEYKTTFSKKYENQAEEMYRRLVWAENVRYIQQHNLEFDQGEHTFTLGVNGLADLSNKEYQALYLHRSSVSLEPRSDDASSTYRAREMNVKDLPRKVDGRNSRCVSFPKPQGECKTESVANAVIGSLEFQYCQKIGKFVALSKQQMFDCGGFYGIDCFLGSAYNGFVYFAGSGLEPAADYSASTGNVNDQCKYNRSKSVAIVTFLSKVDPPNEISLQGRVAQIPAVAVRVDASHNSFRFYRSGIYNEQKCNQTDLNFDMLLVGYDESTIGDYWTVRNGWGPDWGMGGYIFMARNRNNQCGIASYALIPSV